MAAQQLLDLKPVDQAKLMAFHARHFPNQPPPDLRQTTPRQMLDVDDLGYYDDGVRRTLTDEQIAIFRHSEIQRLLRGHKRRHKRTKNGKSLKTDQFSTHEKPRPSSETRSREARARPRGFDDDVEDALVNVTLQYDDDAESASQSDKMNLRKFLWPKLG